jgi:hypothetical protein
MLLGGFLALAGKLLMTFQHAEIGQIVLISGFVVNALLIFIPGKQKEIVS